MPLPRLSEPDLRDLVRVAALRQQPPIAMSRPASETAELARCAQDFRAFLPHWHFVNRETGAISSFASLWEGQQGYADLAAEHSWLYLLKAGKLGFTELACAYDGWVARFGPPNARCHLFSRDSRASKDLLGYVRFGLERLPPWMRLPIMADEPGGLTTQSLKLAGGPSDVRAVVSYAAGQHVSIDQSAQHVHLDEFARMLYPEALWSAVESTVAPGGSLHIVTRGAGPEGLPADLWRRSLAGETKLAPYFAPWTAREGRGAGWYQAEARTLTLAGLRQYAPATWEEALQGDDEYCFPGPVLDAVQPLAWGSTPAGVDGDGNGLPAIIRPVQVVHYERHRSLPYPALQERIDALDAAYPGPTYVEQNGPGEAVAENCRRPIVVVPTTGANKPRMIAAVQIALQHRDLAYSAKDWPQLDAELRGYRWDDAGLTQDSVMALVIGYAQMGQGGYVKAWDIGRHHDAAIGVALCAGAQPPPPSTEDVVELGHDFRPASLTRWDRW